VVTAALIIERDAAAQCTQGQCTCMHAAEAGPRRAIICRPRNAPRYTRSWVLCGEYTIAGLRTLLEALGTTTVAMSMLGLP